MEPIQPLPEAPPAPRRQPRTGVVIALTLGAVVVLALTFVGGLVTGIAVSDSATTGGTAGGGSPNSSGNAPGGGADGTVPDVPVGDQIDTCLVGTWETTEYSESADTDQGKVTITGVKRTLEITADGTETITYDGGPAVVTTDEGEGSATYTGTVVYRIGTDGDTMSFQLQSAQGSLSVSAGEGEPKTQELKPGTGSVTYTCSGDRFTQDAPGFSTVLQRSS